jgi:hypothetical protein
MPTTIPQNDNNEKLKNIEEKDYTPLSSFDHATTFDYAKIKGIIEQRVEKLAMIKDFISLKTYHFLEDKVAQEMKILESRAKQKAVESEESNKQQALPKAFFEKRTLRAKSIRID